MPAPSNTAVVLIDPYNDFLHPEGKISKGLPDLSDKDTIAHMKSLVSTARKHDIPIYYGLHQQCNEDTFQGWKHMTGSNKRQQELRFFEKGSFGASIYEGLEPDTKNGDVVVSQHWNSDSFQNTDLDFQLRQREIHNLVFAGLTANTCLEASARRAYELGYNVTMLNDATAGFSKELTDVAVNMIWPLFANRVISVEEWTRELA